MSLNREDYRAAFDELSFSAGFQERTADLLRQRARELEKERTEMTFNKPKRLAVLIAACIALLAVSASAAVLLLSPSQVAEENGLSRLAEAFQGPDAILIDETVESGDFAITLMGLVSGENLRDYAGYDPAVEGARTYAVLGLSRLDGEPLTNQNYDFSRYTMTPLVAGCSPAGVNDWTLGGGGTGFARDGNYYYLIDTQSIEMFADHTVYMAFYEGGVPNNTIFYVNDDGTIEFCGDFTGVQALFTLPLDPAKADPAAAEAFLAENTMGWTNDRAPAEDMSGVLEELDNGETIFTVSNAVPASGEPWSAEEYEAVLAQRRAGFLEMVEQGQMTRVDYDRWNQREEEILAGLRDGTKTAVMGDDGTIYVNDVPAGGQPLTASTPGKALDFLSAEAFQTYMEGEKAACEQQVRDGILSQENYEKTVRDLERVLQGLRDGTMAAALLDNGALFVDETPSDGVEYRQTEDGAVMTVIKDC